MTELQSYSQSRNILQLYIVHSILHKPVLQLPKPNPSFCSVETCLRTQEKPRQDRTNLIQSWTRSFFDQWLNKRSGITFHSQWENVQLSLLLKHIWNCGWESHKHVLLCDLHLISKWWTCAISIIYTYSDLCTFVNSVQYRCTVIVNHNLSLLIINFVLFLLSVLI